MRRLLVNDCLTCIPGTKTFWHDLRDWFDCYPIEGDYGHLQKRADEFIDGTESLIIRNASWFGPLEASKTVPTISLLQDIMEDGPGRETQISVLRESRAVFNSRFTQHKYMGELNNSGVIIPLPVDFSLFEPGNPMGLQQALSLPEGCVCWVGASQAAAGDIKNYPLFLEVVRANPDISFVAVFKDQMPEYCPPNMRMYCRVTQEELCKIMGACRVGLCTSKTETQHLAGIEMGACGLPLVVPPVGTYWGEHMPGAVIKDGDAAAISAALRAVMASPGDPQRIRDYWKKEFSKDVVRAAWTKLVEEVECSGQS